MTPVPVGTESEKEPLWPGDRSTQRADPEPLTAMDSFLRGIGLPNRVPRRRGNTIQVRFPLRGMCLLSKLRAKRGREGIHTPNVPSAVILRRPPLFGGPFRFLY